MWFWSWCGNGWWGGSWTRDPSSRGCKSPWDTRHERVWCRGTRAIRRDSRRVGERNGPNRPTNGDRQFEPTRPRVGKRDPISGERLHSRVSQCTFWNVVSTRSARYAKWLDFLADPTFPK
eukprot:scaffold6979_cov56-Attheya_sp.AAC.6